MQKLTQQVAVLVKCAWSLYNGAQDETENKRFIINLYLYKETKSENDFPSTLQFCIYLDASNNDKMH